MAEQLYGELFDDDGHFLLVFCDSGNGGVTYGYYMGSQARRVLDDEALSILAEYLQINYYDTSLSEEEIFSSTFTETADRIMTVTSAPIVPITIVVVVAIGAIVVFFVVKSRARAKREEAEQLERILDTPLEKFSDQHVEDLADKYESMDDPGKK